MLGKHKTNCGKCEIYKDEIAYLRKMVDMLHSQLGIGPVDDKNIRIGDDIKNIIDENAPDRYSTTADVIGD
jgi:hypothetical protein